MACRSILGRILEAARKERLIATNPVREVEAPKPRLDPEQVFGHQRRRTLTPEEVGHLLAACRPSTATTSSSRSAPGCAAASCWACAAAGSSPSWAASRSSRSAMRPAGSAAASRPNPRAWPAREWCLCATRSGRPSPASWPAAPGPEDLVLPGPGGSNGILTPAPGRRCPPTTCAAPYKDAVETAEADLSHLTCGALMTYAHLRHLVGGRRHPLAGDRWLIPLAAAATGAPAVPWGGSTGRRPWRWWPGDRCRTILM